MRDAHIGYSYYALDLFVCPAHIEIVRRAERLAGRAAREGKAKMSRTAIVPGASRGIGRAVAKRLAKDGFAVVVNYASNVKEAEATSAEIQSAGGQAIAVRADVGNESDVESLFAEAVNAFGTINVVVNNSGIMPLSPIGKGDVGTFDRIIQTNLRGTFLVMAQAARHVSPGGRIIAFSSSVLARSFPTYGPYIASKPASKDWFTCSPTNCVAGILQSTPLRPGRSARNCS